VVNWFVLVEDQPVEAGLGRVVAHETPPRCGWHPQPPVALIVVAAQRVERRDIVGGERTKSQHRAMVHVYPGAPHGFERFAPNSTAGRQALQPSASRRVDLAG
jgi:acetyl esterase/lipase